METHSLAPRLGVMCPNRGEITGARVRVLGNDCTDTPIVCHRRWRSGAFFSPRPCPHLITSPNPTLLRSTQTQGESAGLGQVHFGSHTRLFLQSSAVELGGRGPAHAHDRPHRDEKATHPLTSSCGTTHPGRPRMILPRSPQDGHVSTTT